MINLRIPAAVAVAVALMAAVSGCGAGGQGKDSDTFVVATIGGPASLDPTLTNDQPSAEVIKQVYDTLLVQDLDTLEPLPSLAERWKFENDAEGRPTKLRLFLRNDVVFHNGDRFTAGDVKFNLDRASASPQVSHIAGEILSTEVVNDYEVLLTLRSPFIPILNNLAHTAMSIVSERAVRELGDKYAQNPVGTGPMKFVNWVVGNRIELTRWDQYWGPAPKIKNLTIRYISDDATRLLELETGGVDMMLNVPPQEVERVEANPNLKLYRAPSLSLNFIGFNTQKPPLNDERVRRAITHAIDMEALVKTVYMGVGKPGRGPIGSMVWASAADILPQLEYNPALAKELLAEAGYPDGFTITLSTNDSAQRVDSAIIVQSMLAAVGIKVEISIVEWAAYLEMLDSGKQDMYILGWVTVTGDPDYGLEVFHSRSFGPGGNYAFYEDPEVDRLLDAARGETDMDLRRQLYIEAQQIIHAAAPWIYTLEGEVLIAARSNVEGFQIDPAQHHPYWTVWFNDK